MGNVVLAQHRRHTKSTTSGFHYTVVPGFAPSSLPVAAQIPWPPMQSREDASYVGGTCMLGFVCAVLLCSACASLLFILALFVKV